MVKQTWWKIREGQSYAALEGGAYRVLKLTGTGKGRRVVYIHELAAHPARHLSTLTVRFRSLVHAPCRECGCTDVDCRRCIQKTGKACSWVEPDLCSACVKGQSV